MKDRIPKLLEKAFPEDGRTAAETSLINDLNSLSTNLIAAKLVVLERVIASLGKVIEERIKRDEDL
ncbi:MAG: hypothetical protein AB7U62_04115 [Pseudolabrys sp.]